MSNEKIRIFYVEATDPYEDTHVVGGKCFFDAEQADALEAEVEEKLGKVYSVITQEIHGEFSHRNGKTDPPEIEGYYWKKMMDSPIRLFVIDEWRKGRWQSWDGSKNVTPIYGPIPMPEEV